MWGLYSYKLRLLCDSDNKMTPVKPVHNTTIYLYFVPQYHKNSIFPQFSGVFVAFRTEQRHLYAFLSTSNLTRRTSWDINGAFHKVSVI